MKRRSKQPRTSAQLLSELVLWRNDPALFEAVLPLARAGDAHAQYALGLMYAEGRGVIPDAVQAYIWLSRAGAQGDADAVLLRDMLMNQMSAQEIALADKALCREAEH